MVTKSKPLIIGNFAFISYATLPKKHTCLTPLHVIHKRRSAMSTFKWLNKSSDHTKDYLAMHI